MAAVRKARAGRARICGEDEDASTRNHHTPSGLGHLCLDKVEACFKPAGLEFTPAAEARPVRCSRLDNSDESVDSDDSDDQSGSKNSDASDGLADSDHAPRPAALLRRTKNGTCRCSAVKAGRPAGSVAQQARMSPAASSLQPAGIAGRNGSRRVRS